MSLRQYFRDRQLKRMEEDGKMLTKYPILLESKELMLREEEAYYKFISNALWIIAVISIASMIIK